MAGFRDVKASFAKYTENDTVGVSLTNAIETDLSTMDVVTVTGLNIPKKSATKVEAYASSTAAYSAPTVGKEYVVAEDCKAGAKFIVLYRIKADDVVDYTHIDI